MKTAKVFLPSTAVRLDSNHQIRFSSFSQYLELPLCQCLCQVLKEEQDNFQLYHGFPQLSCRCSGGISLEISLKIFASTSVTHVFQTCHLIFHSFSLSTSAYTLKFKKDAMRIGEDAQAAQFDFKVDYDDDFDLLLRDTLYPALKIKFFLKRRLTSHFMQVSCIAAM